MVNYEDERFQQVEADKNEAMNNLAETYDSMIEQSDSYYQAQMDASKEWGDKQQQLQQEQTDFAIEKIEQQKEQTEKDYKKEQSGAYIDWKVESNRYGANAETMAQQGLINSGYAESSQVSMYNTYQNRVAQARESYQRAVQNYDNAMTEARLQNNSVLAEIAYKSLQTQLELSLQGFQYKNQLVLDKTSKLIEMENMYYNRYQDVLQQVNNEIALSKSGRSSKGSSGGSGAGGYAAIKKPIEEANTEGTPVTNLGDALKNAVGSIKKSIIPNAKNTETVPIVPEPTPDAEAKQNVASNPNVPKETDSAVQTYTEAARYLKKNGLNATGLLSEKQWKAKKEAGEAAMLRFTSYSEYLQWYTHYQLLSNNVWE